MAQGSGDVQGEGVLGIENTNEISKKKRNSCPVGYAITAYMCQYNGTIF
jgi:hypothetical protein